MWLIDFYIEHIVHNWHKTCCVVNMLLHAGHCHIFYKFCIDFILKYTERKFLERYYKVLTKHCAPVILCGSLSIKSYIAIKWDEPLCATRQITKKKNIIPNFVPPRYYIIIMEKQFKRTPILLIVVTWIEYLRKKNNIETFNLFEILYTLRVFMRLNYTEVQ